MSKDRETPGDLQMQVLVLYAVAMMQPVSCKDLCQTLQISRMTLYRQIEMLAANFGVKIRFVTLKTGVRGRHGVYKILDWGSINPEHFVEHVQSMLSEHREREQAKAWARQEVQAS